MPCHLENDRPLSVDAPSPPDSTGARPRRRRSGRELGRWAVLPWTLAVFYPLVATTTVFWGLMAVALSFLSRRVAFYCGTVWAWCLCWAALVRVKVSGRENARQGQSFVILCNHQGDFDILALYGFLGREFRWVMKQELRSVPFLGWGCAAIGHIFVDRSSPRDAIASLDAAKPQLAGGVSVLFFPEGTRSDDGRLLPFKKGGFIMARQLGLPLLPVTISGSRRVLPKGSLLPLPGTIRVTIHPPLAQEPDAPLEAVMADARRIIASGLARAERGI